VNLPIKKCKGKIITYGKGFQPFWIQGSSDFENNLNGFLKNNGDNKISKFLFSITDVTLLIIIGDATGSRDGDAQV